MAVETELAAESAQADEVRALRRGAGAFLLPRDVVFVQGEDAESYLQGQLSQDVVALTIGQSADSLLLEPDGKLSALLRVTRIDPQGFVLEVDGGYGDAVTRLVIVRSDRTAKFRTGLQGREKIRIYLSSSNPFDRICQGKTVAGLYEHRHIREGPTLPL